MSLARCLTTAWRIRRVPRRVEFFQDTLAQQSEIEDVRVFDTTLRDGEQSPRTSLSYEEKRGIAETPDDVGIHIIETGFLVNSEAEFGAVTDIAASTDATACGLIRVADKDIEAALDSGMDMVHAFVNTSNVQLTGSIHASREGAVERTVCSVEHARDADVEVMFLPMDVTRIDESFLIEVVEVVSGAGVDWINLPDTCDMATPTRFVHIVMTVREHTDARIGVHVRDGFGLASANAMTSLEVGAAQAQVSANGIGERTGDATYEGVVMTAESLYGIDTGIDTTKITELTRVVETVSDIPVPANKPVVDRNTFSHKSGIHTADVIENANTFEPGVMAPEMAGATRGSMLSRHTGTHSVRKRLADIGFDPSDAEVREVTRRVKDHGTEKGRVDDSTLEVFVRDVDITHEDDTEGEVRA